MQQTATIVNQDLINDIVTSNLLLGLDGALERITLQISQLYKPSPSMLTNAECADIVAVLDSHSLFLLRDYVTTLFKILPVTKPTIYNYMRIKNEKLL
jgi:predicted transcriptional regulator YheO